MAARRDLPVVPCEKCRRFAGVEYKPAGLKIGGREILWS